LKARQKQCGAAGAEKEFFVLENRRQGSIYWLSTVALRRNFSYAKIAYAEISHAQKLRTQKL
jgi:hypothetical protein